MFGNVEMGGIVFEHALPPGEGFIAFERHKDKAYLKTGHNLYSVEPTGERDTEGRMIWAIGEVVELDAKANR